MKYGKGIEKTSYINDFKLNITLISFILSFSSLSVIFQIKSCFKKKISLIRIITYKLIHGTLSVIITIILINTFNISIPVYENIYENLTITNKMHNIYIITMSFIIFSLATYFLITYFKKESKNISKLY